MVKKKKSGVLPEKQSSGSTVQSSGHESGGDVSQETSETESLIKILPFKNGEFMSNRSAVSTKKSRGWKNLKQILISEKLPPNVVSYGSLDAPPSKRPPKKYSDLSGLTAKYKDPTTKLLYHNTDEFAEIRMLSPDIITGYLELRKANE